MGPEDGAVGHQAVGDSSEEAREAAVAEDQEVVASADSVDVGLAVVPPEGGAASVEEEVEASAAAAVLVVAEASVGGAASGAHSQWYCCVFHTVLYVYHLFYSLHLDRRRVRARAEYSPLYRLTCLMYNRIKDYRFLS